MADGVADGVADVLDGEGDAAAGFAGKPVSFAPGAGGVTLLALAAVGRGAGVGAGEGAAACLAGGVAAPGGGGVAFAAGAEGASACACCRCCAKPADGAVVAMPSPAGVFAPPLVSAPVGVPAGIMADPGASVDGDGSGKAASCMRKLLRPAGTAGPQREVQTLGQAAAPCRGVAPPWRDVVSPVSGGKACRVNPAGRRGIPAPDSEPAPTPRRIFSASAAKAPERVLARFLLSLS